MNIKEIEALYNRVVSGKTIVEYNGIIYIVYDPIPQQKLLSECEYERAYTRFLPHGLSEEEVQIVLEERELWTPTSDKELEYLNKRLTEIEQSIIKHQYNSEVVKLFQEQKDSLVIRRDFLKKSKNTLSNKTVEYLAMLEKYKYFIFLNAYYINDDGIETKCWKNYAEYRLSSEHTINFLMNVCLFDDRFNEKNIRELARSEIWRVPWAASRKGVGDLFDKPLTQISDVQRLLVAWSLIYDSAYESTECPSQDIINNDEAFDEWLKDSSKKRDQSKTKITNKKIENSKEIGIMVSNIDDAKKVFEKNTSESQKILENRNKVISEKGVITEGQLPDVQMDLKLKRNQLAMARKGK